MRFDTMWEHEKEIIRLEAKVEELEKILDSLHRGATKGSCCEPPAHIASAAQKEDK